ncbi:MAG: hypothetical protein FWC72_02105 [Oscillospiraceae bacterium]|nr:hypothetical protein [Oscillospiraceae bacterium]
MTDNYVPVCGKWEGESTLYYDFTKKTFYKDSAFPKVKRWPLLVYISGPALVANLAQMIPAYTTNARAAVVGIILVSTLAALTILALLSKKNKNILLRKKPIEASVFLDEANRLFARACEGIFIGVTFCAGCFIVSIIFMTRFISYGGTPNLLVSILAWSSGAILIFAVTPIKRIKFIRLYKRGDIEFVVRKEGT